jgi:hypothetical protein
VDVLFNKCKTGGGAYLQYTEFIQFLDVLGVFALDIGTQIDPPNEQIILNPSPKPDETIKIMPSVSSASKSPVRETESRKAKRLRQQEPYLGVTAAKARYLFPIAHLINRKSSSVLLTAILLLASSGSEPWMVEFSSWIETEAAARAGSFVISIQCMIRRKLARIRVKKVRIMKNNFVKQSRIDRAATSICGFARMCKARKRIIEVARKTMILYIPHKGQKYWNNPKTGVSSFTKPKILRSAECREIPLPPPKLEYLIACSNCEVKQALYNCNQCEDSLCKTCYSTLHCKGKKMFHKTTLIPMCSLCKFQMATKNCTSCSLRKPMLGSPEELIEGEKGLLCDTCYIHVHDKLSLTHVSNSGLADISKEAYLTGGKLQQRLDTSHRHVSLVQVCEECSWRSAAYRCAECDQTYCNTCLIGMHSMGGPFSSHKAEKLPYYTPNMHVKYEKANFEQRLQKRIDKIAQSYARKLNEKRTSSVIKLQSWWRMILGARVGRQYMKEMRLSQRRAWRLRKYETMNYRESISYKILNVFGMAPELSSDTREEKVLNKLSIFNRQPARLYIWGNVEDWGYMQAKGKGTEEANAPRTRKGVPHTGFDVGTIEELIEQSRYGGYRLPGTIDLVQGQVGHEVSMDLTTLLKIGMLIRLNKSFFKIVEVNKTSIIFNRKWREVSQKGIRLYIMPCQPGQKYRRYYKFRHDLFDYVCGNVVSQTFFELYRKLMLKSSVKCKSISVVYKRNGMLQLSKKWKNRSEACKIKADKYASLMYDASLSDVSSVDSKVNNTKDLAKMNDPAKLKIKSRRKEDRIPGVPWEASDEEINANILREKLMSVQQRAAEAHMWEEKFDPVKNVKYYFNTVTDQIMYTVPGAVAAKLQMDADAEAAKKAFLETQKKIAQLNNTRAVKKSLGGKR